MGSIGAGEVLVILLVALIVFGPHRLPEISRKAGELLAKAREMSKSITESFGDEFGDIAAPIKDLKSEYDSTMGHLKSAASSVAGMSIDIPQVSLNPKDILKQKPGDGHVAANGDETSVADVVEDVTVEDVTVEGVTVESAGDAVVAEVVEQGPVSDEGPATSPDEEAS